MIHERLELERWIRAFPLSDIHDRRREHFNAAITGPAPVACVEQIRNAVLNSGRSLGRQVPVDLCVWKHGPAAGRESTRIGGVPYWPEDEPWPYTESDEPFTFIAQFCFADSTDILPELPGDILSVLAAESDNMHVELCWFRLGETLVPEDQLPDPRWKLKPCHAVLHRTAEFPDANCEFFDEFPFPVNLWARRFQNASKIGGVWMMRGELPDPDDVKDPAYRRLIEESWEEVRRYESSFLCTLSAIEVMDRWPFLNVASRDDLPAFNWDDFLQIGDVGGYDFFQIADETHASVFV